MLKPQTPVPPLSIETAGHGRWTLADQTPEHFSMVVFYRGLHCPVCKTYAEVLARLKPQLAELGVEPVLISADTQTKAQETAEKWKIDGLPLGYGLTEADMRAWGLYVSRAIKDVEPDLFCEPGLFVVRPDGELYYAAVNSMPFGRPDLEAFTKSLAWVLKANYPGRGEA
ncbi:MAG: peroxiredoxin-like family protein [Planctomycetota bacterium]